MQKFITHENNHFVVNLFGIRMKFQNLALIKAQNNKIYIEKNGIRKEYKKDIKGLKISIQGNNNQVVIGYPYHFTNSRIVIRGDNNIVIIEQTKHGIGNLYIDMCGRIASGRKVHIKKNLFMNGCSMYCMTNNSSIVIGEECQFSWNTVLMNSDAHIIEDLRTHEQINHGTHCEVGNNVWVCQNAYIGKNVKIPDNSIVGAFAVVTKTFDEKNIAIGGNPAKIIKRNIAWKRDDDN